MRLFRLLLDPKAGEGDGGGTSGGDPDKARESLQNLLTKHNNDAQAVALILLSENHGYRERIRDLRGKVPADGAVVLTGEEATAWAEYRKLGKPADLTTALTERSTYKADLDRLRTAETVRDAADLSGFKPTVLATLVKAEGLDLTISETKPDAKSGGKAQKIVTVKDGDKDVPLGEYAEAHWQDHLPALKADSARPPGTPNREDRREIPKPAEGDASSEDRERQRLVRSGRYAF